MLFRLWKINRVLRWAGVLLIVSSDGKKPEDPDRQPTRVGLVFMGWPPEAAWARYCARDRQSTETLERGAGDLGPELALGPDPGS